MKEKNTKKKASLTSVSASEQKEKWIAENGGELADKAGNRPSETKKGKGKEEKVSPVRILPLGGLDRIGMNCTVFEYEDDLIVVDAGIAFPQDDMPGVEVVIPDFSYLIENADRIRGLILTHGHEDHIGAVPYLLKDAYCAVYGTRLTLGILEEKLKEHDLKSDNLFEVRAGEILTLGAFEVEFIHVNHSMPDSVGLCIETPCGRIVMTGDFKIDYTPIGTDPIDLERFAALGRKGVKLLLADSTNVERPGFTPSDSTLTMSFDRIFSETSKRILVATFASNVHRVQQILDAAEKWGRKVAVTGRSMENVMRAAEELGYLHIPDGLLIDIGDAKYFLPEELTILTTGTQGEPMSALFRMAFGTHSMITLGPDDIVVLSSSCIPGNERFVNRIINEMYRKKVTVITDRTDDVHVSGHACREELKLIHRLVQPENFIPVHGEYRHLAQHAQLAKTLGMDPAHILIAEAGHTVYMDPKGIRFGEILETGPVMIDVGIGNGVESAVLSERRKLAEGGIVAVTCCVDREGDAIYDPDIITKGFILEKENEELLSFLKERTVRCVQRCLSRGIEDEVSMNARLKEDIANAVFEKTKRKPVLVTHVILLS